MLKAIVSDVTSELKPAKIIAFLAVLLIAGWILSLAKNLPLVDKINKFQVK